MRSSKRDDPPGSDAQEAGAQRDLLLRARTAILWIGSTSVLAQACNWGLTLLTARILMPEDYGILSLAGTLSPFLGMLATLNLSTWIVQTDRFEARDKASMYALTTAVGLGMALFGISIAPLIGQFFDNPDMVQPFQAISLTFVLRGTSLVPLASLQRELDFKPISLMNLVVGVSSGILQLTLAWLGFGYWSLVAGIVYREAASAMWAHFHVGLPKGFSWDPALYRRAIGYGTPATAAMAAALLFNSSDKIVVGKLFDVELLGYYSMAFFLTDLPLSRMNTVLRPVFLPYFARLREFPDRMRDHFRLFVLAVASLVFPVFLGIAVVAHDLVGVVLGEKWLPMVQPLQVLCIVGLLRAFIDNVPHLLFAIGRPKQVLRLRLLYLVVLPPCFLLSGSSLGIAGIYLTWLVAFPAVSIAVLLVLRKEVGITPMDYAMNLLPPLVSSCAMAACTYLTQETLRANLPPAALVVAAVIVGALCYFGVYWTMFRKDAGRFLDALRRDR
jgi:O-antigen/teichoic acid export membrane protein